MHLVAIFTGRFFNRPKSIQAGNGVLFEDDGAGNYTIAHKLAAGQGIAFATAGDGTVTLRRGSYLAKAVAATGTTALSGPEALNDALEFTGAITGNVVVTVPALNAGDAFDLFNNTTGAHTLTFKGLSGNGILITQGKRVRARCNGTDIFAWTPEA